MNTFLSAVLCRLFDALIINFIDATVQNNVLSSIGQGRNHSGQISGSAGDLDVLFVVVLLTLPSYICPWQVSVL
jgi:hypothetical protein